jgi:hypothetical protein
MFPITQIRIKRLSEFRGIVVNLFYGLKKPYENIFTYAEINCSLHTCIAAYSSPC